MEKKTIKEELTKKDIKSEIELTLNSRDFKKKVQEICDDTIENLFKVLWQRKVFWKK
jgi:hypothetical protein